MKIYMTSYYTGGPVEYRPGEIVDLPDAEASRVIEAGGARALTADESAALPDDPKPAPKAVKAKG